MCILCPLSRCIDHIKCSSECGGSLQGVDDSYTVEEVNSEVPHCEHLVNGVIILPAGLREWCALSTLHI